MLDPFAGRAIIPLEAARLGARAEGIDYSPVATIGGRLLADYTLRDWRDEPWLPIPGYEHNPLDDRLTQDVAAVLDKIGKRYEAAMAPYYPGDIAVGSAGLRLAPPKPASGDIVLGGDARAAGVTGGSATDTTAAPGTAPAGSAFDSTSTTGGAASGGGMQQPELKEREIAFSLMTSMSEPGIRDAVRRLLLDLSNAADDGNISWAQIQVKVVVAEEAAAKIDQDVRDTGTNPSNRGV